MLYSLKALQCRAFFVVTLLSLGLPAAGYTDCAPVGDKEWVTVAEVYDGDTLLLDDSRKVRLIGINTAEMGRDGAPDEPHAKEAKQLLQSLVDASTGRLRLLPGLQTQDRYHRTLAHLYDGDGNNLTASLLQAGAGFLLVMPPNLTNLDCYRKAERHARQGRLGVWRHDPVLDAANLRSRETGFHLIRARIERVGKGRKSIWLNLHEGPVIRIAKDDWEYFKDWDSRRLKGRTLEVRGWINRHKKKQRMRIYHPAAVRWLD